MKSKIRNDFILIGVILSVAFAVFLYFKLTAKKGDVVKVIIDGETVATYKSDQDITEEILTKDGGKNILVIKDKEAYIKYANCRDKICQNHSPISNDGETIVCLPHKVVIAVESEASK